MTGTLTIIGVVFAAAVALGLYFYFASSRRELDQVSLCPDEPDGLTVMLVDVTDPMTRAQATDFRNQFERLTDQIERHHQLQIARVDEAATDAVANVLLRCNPGTSEDVSAATADPAKVQRLHDAQFSAPLAAAFDQIVRERAAERSPIFEAIQTVALKELKKPIYDGKPRRLIIVSDLLQHTPPSLDFYRSRPDRRSLLESDAFRRLRTDLSGVSVELWMLQRSDTAATQPRALVDLWADALSEQGATVERVYNVSG